MRSHRFLLLCLALVLCLHSAIAAPHHAIRRQEDENASQIPASTASRSARPSMTTSPTRSDHASSIAESSAKPSVASSGTMIQVPVTTDSTIPSSTPTAGMLSCMLYAFRSSMLTLAATDPNNSLPIQPKVTPAMGLAGALLLITGLVYAVIGIKNKW